MQEVGLHGAEMGDMRVKMQYIKGVKGDFNYEGSEKKVCRMPVLNDSTKA
jgi:hypothetical protein